MKTGPTPFVSREVATRFTAPMSLDFARDERIEIA